MSSARTRQYSNHAVADATVAANRYPTFVDWTGNGLCDLMLPNETNRIVWYENVGTESEPRFGEQKFIVVEGYEEFDTAEARAASGRRESRQLAVCSACCLLVRS